MRHAALIGGFFLVLISACTKQEAPSLQTPVILPAPSQWETPEGVLSFTKNLSIHTDAPELTGTATGILEQKLSELFGMQLDETDSNPLLLFQTDNELAPEAYSLNITAQGITVKASASPGFFYAAQSLIQLIATQNGLDANQAEFGLSAASIVDEPTFTYRGMHLDVGRHLFPAEFIKKYIDMLATHKMNRFHWHLTEDQGWRMQITKYPKLTEIGGFRDSTVIGRNTGNYNAEKYGGFYTTEEIKDIVAYAASREVTIIPEIEMPGHSTAAIAAYPELGNTDVTSANQVTVDGVSQLRVATRWGIFEDIYSPTDETFSFLEDVLTEVMELFPSEYIHIGGDEAPKKQWEKSAIAQEVMKREGLEDEHELQSYFIRRIEQFLNENGRNIIGWDEILEGGLAPNATVMSWRGEAGGIEAAKAGHDVIMTPGSHCYFDHYQFDPATEPLAIGGYTTLEKVYSYQPVPEELNEEEGKHVLGAQGNVWTEYMNNSDHVEYMAFPRAVALAEVLWTGPGKGEYADFVERLSRHSALLDAYSLNYARHFFNPLVEVQVDNTEISVRASNPREEGVLKYKMVEEEVWETYEEVIEVDSLGTYEFALFMDEDQVSEKVKKSVVEHKGLGASITSNTDLYRGRVAESLINGIPGGGISWQQDEWVGKQEEPLFVELQWEQPQSINRVSTQFFDSKGSWIHLPLSATLMISEDGTEFTEWGKLEPQQAGGSAFSVNFTDINQTVKAIRIVTEHPGIIPMGSPGAGNNAWVFMDEVIVF